MNTEHKLTAEECLGLLLKALEDQPTSGINLAYFPAIDRKKAHFGATTMIGKVGVSAAHETFEGCLSKIIQRRNAIQALHGAIMDDEVRLNIRRELPNTEEDDAE